MKPILLVALGKDAHLGLEALLENLRSSAHGRGITWKNQAQFRYARIAVLNLDAGPLRSDALDSAATEFRRARSSGRDRELPDPELWRAAGAPEPDFDQRYGDRRSYGLLFLREAIREAQRGGEPLIRLPDGPEGLETGAVIVCGDPLNGGLTELRAHLGHHSMPEEVRRCPWDLFVLPPDTAGPERARVGGLLAELGEQRGEPGTAFRHRFLVPGRAGAGLETMRLLLTTRWRNEPAERTLLVAGERRDLTEEVEGVTARKAVSLALDRVGRAIERRRGKAPDLEAARAEHRRVSVEAGAARDRMVADARQEYERELEGLRSEQERAEARQEEQEETLRSRLDHDHQVHVRQGQEADRRRDELEAELGRWSEQEETRERQRRLASLEARESEEAEQRAARREKLEADLDLAEVKWQLTAERAGVLEAERTRLEAELQEALRSLEGRAAELREEADDGRRCAEAARETARRAREVLLPGYQRARESLERKWLGRLRFSRWLDEAQERMSRLKARAERRLERAEELEAQALHAQERSQALARWERGAVEDEEDRRLVEALQGAEAGATGFDAEALTAAREARAEAERRVGSLREQLDELAAEGERRAREQAAEKEEIRQAVRGEFRRGREEAEAALESLEHVEEERETCYVVSRAKLQGDLSRLAEDTDALRKELEEREGSLRDRLAAAAAAAEAEYRRALEGVTQTLDEARRGHASWEVEGEELRLLAEELALLERVAPLRPPLPEGEAPDWEEVCEVVAKGADAPALRSVFGSLLDDPAERLDSLVRATPETCLLVVSAAYGQAAAEQARTPGTSEALGDGEVVLLEPWDPAGPQPAPVAVAQLCAAADANPTVARLGSAMTAGGDRREPVPALGGGAA